MHKPSAIKLIQASLPEQCPDLSSLLHPLRKRVHRPRILARLAAITSNPRLKQVIREDDHHTVSVQVIDPERQQSIVFSGVSLSVRGGHFELVTVGSRHRDDEDDDNGQGDSEKVKLGICP